MARTRRTISLEEKIEKAQNAVYLAKDKYDAAVEELNQLLKKKREMQRKDIQKALETSTRTYCIRRIPVAAFAAASGHGAERVAGVIEF